jgi:hypothetical protein
VHPHGAIVILHINYEELQALRAGARAYLSHGGVVSDGAVLAPPEGRARVEALVAHLEGDISVETLDELRKAQAGVAAIVEQLRVEMQSAVLATHAADESAVSAYFDFAHGLTVAHRLDEMAGEMAAMIELVTGESPSIESARSFKFPD